MKYGARFLLLGLASVVLVHCAKGATLGNADGDGGDGPTTGEGAGPSSGGAGAGGAGAGASGSTGGAPTTSSTGGTATNPDTSSGSSTSSGSTSSGSTSSGSTSSSSSTSTSSSSTGGGPVDCNPMNPGAVCAPTEHCYPTPDGKPVCEGPVGSGGVYSACLSAADCQAPLNCIDTGDIFLLPCCLSWCTSSANCSAGSTCTYLATPVYVNGVEYGVCYDGLGGC